MLQLWIKQPPVRASVRSLRLLGLMCLAAILLPVVLHAIPPNWWHEQNVIDQSREPNDYAAVNQGQLKNIATQAAAELDAHLPGGINTPAGAHLRELLAGFSEQTSSTNDYAAVNLGQLKAVAKPFYELLNSVWSTNTYPWTGHEAQADDYAVANLGQVKNLFSFDLLAVTPANDLDGDHIADWWERYYFPTTYGTSSFNPNALAARGDGLTILQCFQQGLNPNDFYNGQTPSLTIVGGDGQSGGGGGFVSEALAVQVLVKGQPVQNARVTFATSQGGGQVQATLTSSPVGTVTVRTNAAGVARSFYQLPNTLSTSYQVTASAGIAPAQATVSFTESSGDNTYGTQTSPCSISNFYSAPNPDGSELLTWTNNTDDTIPIYDTAADGHLIPLVTLPAGTTSYLVPAP